MFITKLEKMKDSDPKLQSLMHLAVVASGSDTYEASNIVENIGQQELKNHSVLPIKGDWETLELWGVKKLDAHDNLFCGCILPAGWRKETNSDYWTVLLDDRGRKRASIFYKSAFWDREAHFSVSFPIYYTTRSTDEDGQEFYYIATKLDDSLTLWKGDQVAINWDDTNETWEKLKTMRESAESKLQEMFPLLQDPLAYWD